MGVVELSGPRRLVKSRAMESVRAPDGMFAAGSQCEELPSISVRDDPQTVYPRNDGLLRRLGRLVQRDS